MRFVIDPHSDLNAESIAKFGEKLNRGIRQVMERESTKVQDYARNNAPWHDQTGNARNGLFAIYDSDTLHSLNGESTIHRITLSHSVPYGIWLEVRWAGRYAIIVPTIQHYGAKIMDSIRGLISRLDGVG
jgi:hypothetical protein